jgi:hypothetical protein
MLPLASLWQCGTKHYVFTHHIKQVDAPLNVLIYAATTCVICITTTSYTDVHQCVLLSYMHTKLRHCHDAAHL